MDYNEYIEGEPNTLFIGFFDGKIILNKNEDEDAYQEIEFGQEKIFPGSEIEITLNLMSNEVVFTVKSIDGLELNSHPISHPMLYNLQNCYFATSLGNKESVAIMKRNMPVKVKSETIKPKK